MRSDPVGGGLGLGCVQFGRDYGIANAAGKPAPATVREILDRVRRAGWTTLDTAAAYGTSEAILGELLPPDHGFRIVSKLRPLNRRSAGDVETWIREEVQGSLSRLRTESVHGFLVHRGGDLLGPDGETVHRVMSDLRSAGRIRAIGASVADPETLIAVLDRFDLDLVQAPLNLLDRRFLSPGVTDALRRTSTVLHARSVLLQGLFLMDPTTLPPHFDAHRATLEGLHTLARERSCSMLTLAIRFVLQQPTVGITLLGVQDPEQLDEIQAASALAIDLDELGAIGCDDLDLIDPSHWP